MKARLLIPVALATMHMSWGWGFLTSPRSLARKVIASRRPAVRAAADVREPESGPSRFYQV